MQSIGVLQGRLTPTPDGSIQFFPKDNWEDEFRLARQIGFDCIELLVKKDSFRKNPLCLGAQEIKRLAAQSGLVISSVHGFYSKAKNYSLILRYLVRQAAFVGARTVLISFFGNNALKTNEDKELACDLIKSVIHDCYELGVCIGIETELAAEELSEWIRSFNHPNIGVYYDIGNMASSGADVAEEIKFLSDKIFGVHIKDRLPNGGPTVPLGEGCVNFYSAFSALREIGYESPLIIQGARLSGVDDIILNRRYHIFVKYVLYEINKTKGGKA